MGEKAIQQALPELARPLTFPLVLPSLMGKLGM